MTPESKIWLNRLSHLYYLPELTAIDSKQSSFIFACSSITHDIYCTPGDDFESAAPEFSSDSTLNHYRANVAALKQLGKYFDYLRNEGVYNNTRIIIVSDHGRGVELKQCKYFSDENKYLVSWYSPIFLCKDFDSTDSVKTDNTFMTNADTIFLAKEGLGLSNINPFTKKVLVQNKENGINVYHCKDWNAEHFKEATEFELEKDRAWHVSNNIYEEKNWIPLLEWEERKRLIE